MTDQQKHHDVEESAIEEEYVCTETELRRAGGFTITNLDEMPETDPEFITDPQDHIAPLEPKHWPACALAEETPIGRFATMLELIEILGLDPTRAASCDPCSVL
jgi:hypothetical protein